MTTFDPKHPHGHILDSGGKVEIIKILDNGWVVGLAHDSAGRPWANAWPPDGSPTRDCTHRLLNAPPPKRTWDVVAVEIGNGRVVFLQRDHIMPTAGKIIGRYTLTEGEGMEEKDG